MRQEGVLLRLVEAVHFVDEDDAGAAGPARGLCAVDGLADVLDAAEHGRDDDELGLEGPRHQPRQRGLAHPRRAPQDHRMQPAGGEGRSQRLAGRQQVALADHFAQHARAQALGQRRVALWRRQQRIGIFVVEQRSGHGAAIVAVRAW